MLIKSRGTTGEGFSTETLLEVNGGRFCEDRMMKQGFPPRGDGETTHG